MRATSYGLLLCLATASVVHAEQEIASYNLTFPPRAWGEQELGVFPVEEFYLAFGGIDGEGHLEMTMPTPLPVEFEYIKEPDFFYPIGYTFPFDPGPDGITYRVDSGTSFEAIKTKLALPGADWEHQRIDVWNNGVHYDFALGPEFYFFDGPYDLSAVEITINSIDLLPVWDDHPELPGVQYILELKVGMNFDLRLLAPVPEPASLALLTAPLALVALRRRRYQSTGGILSP